VPSEIGQFLETGFRLANVHFVKKQFACSQVFAFLANGQLKTGFGLVQPSKLSPVWTICQMSHIVW